MLKRQLHKALANEVVGRVNEYPTMSHYFGNPGHT